MAKRKTNPVERQSGDLVKENIARLKELFPEVVSEGKVDFEKLRATLGEIVDDRPERYSFTWAGKRDAIRLLRVPSRAALKPCPEQSVNWDTTKNLFIEGENLEVLKLLYKSYAGRVKMIYIDPPYNTGKDFIYPDNYADPLARYLEITRQKDAEGNLLTSNPETSGRFHSTWLSMMYPRLFVARQLLREDGVIFVSIDDFEARTLRLIMDEVYGEENFIAQLVWEKGRKNDAKLFSVGHEYMLIYAKSRARLRELKTVWREEKPGAQAIWDEYNRLRKKHGKDDKTIENELVEWFSNLPQNHPSKKLSRYHRIDKYGPWRDRDISWPGGGGPTYDVPHPKTKRPCKVPERGWGFATPEEMERQIAIGLVEFREDHTEPPFRKAHLHPIPEEFFTDDNEDEIPFDDENENETSTNGEELAMQVMPSCIYKQSQVAVKYLRRLMGAKVFDNPKDHEVLARIIQYATSRSEPDIILDFFAGAASTGHAVFLTNLERAGNQRFILVQLPEPTRRPKSNGGFKETEASRAGYETISALARDRLVRAIDECRVQHEGKLDFGGRLQSLGFRKFVLSESSLRQWRGVEEKDGEKYADEMALFTDPFLSGWQPKDVIWEVALKEGYSLSSTVEALPTVKRNQVFRVTDADREQSFCICLDDKLHDKTAEAMALGKENLFVCRDAALTDEQAANLALQCKLKTI